MVGRLRGALAAATLALAITPALADADPTPSDADKQVASEMVKQAIAASQAGDHEGAIALYLEAYAMIPQPVLLSNVGAEYQQMQQPVEALKYFCMYLEKDPAGTNASYATAQAQLLQSLLGKQGEICKPEPAPPPPREVAPKPVAPPPPPAPRERGKLLRWTGLGTATVGLAAIGAGVVFGFKAKHQSDLISDHDPADPWPADIKDIEADGERYERNQIVLMAAGGVVAAAGIGMYVIGRRRGAEVHVTPTASAETVGLAVRGGF